MRKPRILVKVSVARDGSLVLKTTTVKTVRNKLYPAGGDRLGPVLIDTKKHLGITKRAVPILMDLFERAGCDGDGFGDIDWFQSDDGKCVFGWLGPNKVRWHPRTFAKADRSRDGYFREGEYVELDR